MCQNLRNLLWYEKEDSDTFYPRAYMISENEEKGEFIGTFDCDLQVNYAHDKCCFVDNEVCDIVKF